MVQTRNLTGSDAMRSRLAIGIVLVLLTTAILSSIQTGSQGEATTQFYDNGNNVVSGGPVEFPGGPGFDTSYYFKMGKNVPVSEAHLDISTLEVRSGMAPLNPYVDVGLDNNKEWQYEGIGYGRFGEQHAFSDDKSQISIEYGSSGGSNDDNKVYIPQNAEIIDANIGVRGRFQSPTTVPISSYQVEKDPSTVSLQGYAMEHGDMDQDGDIDVVISDTRNHRIIWMENPNSTDEDWPLHVVSSHYEVRDCRSIDVGDIDGDGDLDIAATSYSRNTVMWFRNNNDAGSFTKFRFYSAFRYAGRVRIGDIDKDGNPDIVVSTWYYYHYGSYGTYIYWFEAPNNPQINTTTSSGGSATYWRYHKVANNPTYYYYTYAGMDLGDLNGDGYLDIALSTYPRYSWYNYNRIYTFTNPKTRTGGWTTRSIDSSAQQVHSLACADMDDDGYDDIITATYGGSRIKIYRSGNGGVSYTENTISTFTRPKYILAEDVNDDSKIDIIVGGGSGVYEFAVYYQGTNYLTYTKHTITQAVIDPMAFTPFDSDNDDDIDFMVAGTAGSQLVLINTTDKDIPTHKVRWIEDGGIKDIRGMDSKDMDGDGDLDIVFVAYGTGWVGWMENDGSPFNGAGDVHRIGSLGNPIEVMVADVDGDDDDDIVALSSGGVAYWWENINDPFDTWPGSVIATGIPSAHSLFVGDFTGDGKADIVTSSARGYYGGEVRIYKCPSNPKSTWPMNRIMSGISYMARIWADDMDLDGDLDVLACYGSYGSGTAVYYKNPTGTKDPMSGSWQAVSIGGGMYYPRDIKTIDITDDGYPDVVVAGSYYYSKVKWFQSPYGDQVPSWTGRVLYSGAYNWRIATGDIGNDGYADIMLSRGSYSSASSLYWFEEGVDYTGGWAMRSLGSHSGTQCLAIMDLEGDDVAELLSTSRSLDEIRAYKLDAVFPKDIGLDIGADSSVADWAHTGELKGKTTVDIKSYLQSVIDNEPTSVTINTDRWGTEILDIPFELSSETSGRVQMESINIRYNATVRIDQNGEGKSLSEVIDRLVPDYTDEEAKMRIYIGVGAESEGKAFVDNLYVEYNAIPKLSKQMEVLEVNEDESIIMDFDLNEYFRDDYTAQEDLDIEIVLSGPKADSINAAIVNGRLALDATVTPNFYTRLSEPYDIYAQFRVTDTGGPNNVPERTLLTQRFPLLVWPINDEPVVTGQNLPILYGVEGETVIVADLNDYDLFYDADRDPIQYRLRIPEFEDIPDYNESANLKVTQIGSKIEVSLDDFSDWTGTIPLTIYGTDDPRTLNIYQTARVETLIQINNTNDPPNWTPIPRSTVLEDVDSPRILELTRFVDDIDTLPKDMTITIDDWTNRSFISIKLEYLTNGQVYLQTIPRVPNWYGWTTITLTISDGEFFDTTTMDIIVEQVNDLPSIKILEPSENGRVEPGPFSIAGEAHDVEGIVWVEVLFLDGTWEKAVGKGSWGITLEAPRYDDMREKMPIQVRAFDGEEFAYAYVNVTILKYIPVVISDSDGDMHPDIGDDFPNDPSEWKDSDRDGLGDNSDPFPFNAAWRSDSDKDETANTPDTDPYDPMLWNDNNRDGRNDDEIIKGNDNIIKEPEEKKWWIPILFFILAGIALIFAVLSSIAFVIKRNASKDPKKMARFYAFEQRWREKQSDLIEKGPFARLSSKVSDSVTASGPSPTMSVPAPVRSLPGGPQPAMARPGLPPIQPTARPFQPGKAMPPGQLRPPVK